MALPPRRYDEAWKYFADHFLTELLAYAFPAVYAAIDWQHEPIVRDSELAALGLESTETLRSDKLVLVHLYGPQPQPALLLIEFQSQYDADFSRRVFRYALRIADHSQLPLAVLTVLADQLPNWRPQLYNSGWGGSNFLLSPVVYKLLDQPLHETADDQSFTAAFVRLIHGRGVLTAMTLAWRLSRCWPAAC